MTRRATTSTRHDGTSSIVERATARDVLRLAGFAEPNRSGMISCPIHAERSASFHLLTKGFRCFGCGARGGILDLIAVLGVAGDRATAARWLEENFGHD
uniref:Zinc finger CHC2-type domain-containing protein n=1 Tax=mine drainage metagenome TaxID=410659 RepID=E6PBZ8_9ZZZZ